MFKDALLTISIIITYEAFSTENQELLAQLLVTRLQYFFLV